MSTSRGQDTGPIAGLLQCGSKSSPATARCGKWLLVTLIWIPFVWFFVSFYSYDSPTKSFQVSSESDTEAYQVAQSTPLQDQHYGSPSLKPRQHVYYLKTHKTGSTTMYSILAEYCRSRGLLPLLPSGLAHINNKPPFSPSQVLLHPNVKKYDMVFNHHVYNKQIFDYLHSDTFRFTTLREPFKQFVSSFKYFRDTDNFPYLTNVKGSDPLSTFLADPQKYENNGYDSYTNNRQAMDMGYQISQGFYNTEYIKKFIAETERNFDMILITDYFHESLILLKRTLHWTTGDILYYKKLARKEKQVKNETLLAWQKEQHRKFSKVDITLYEHYLPIFKERLSKERDIEGEKLEFEDALNKVHAFCDSEDVRGQLLIPAGRWSDEINILHTKCKWLKLEEVQFTTHLQTTQKALFKT